MSDLNGKIALVSGASRGLGRAVARELAAAGAHVVATGRSRRGSATQTAVDDLTLDRTVEMVAEAGGSAEAVTCDHTDPDAVRRLVDDVLARHGRIDVLVNNAWGGHDHHEEPTARRSGTSRWSSSGRCCSRAPTPTSSPT